jgi:hypothetical protein
MLNHSKQSSLLWPYINYKYNFFLLVFYWLVFTQLVLMIIWVKTVGFFKDSLYFAICIIFICSSNVCFKWIQRLRNCSTIIRDTLCLANIRFENTITCSLKTLLQHWCINYLSWLVFTEILMIIILVRVANNKSMFLKLTFQNYFLPFVK